MIRISPELHAALRQAAAVEGLSLNDYCVRKLAAPKAALADIRGLPEAVGRAAELFGDTLFGVVAYGSWARGELADGSDVDLLIVLDSTVQINRELYRRWDECPMTVEGRAVEPHFVHLPIDDERPGGVWPEIATDGIVLFERDVGLSSHLSRVRRLIASGRLVRRVVHGQPYWAEVA